MDQFYGSIDTYVQISSEMIFASSRIETNYPVVFSRQIPITSLKFCLYICMLSFLKINEILTQNYYKSDATC